MAATVYVSNVLLEYLMQRNTNGELVWETKSVEQIFSYFITIKYRREHLEHLQYIFLKFVLE